MKEQIQSPITVVICILIAVYLGGFFWVRSGGNNIPGSKIFILDVHSSKGKIGKSYYRPLFWIDEKLFGEQIIILDGICHQY